MGSLNSSVGVEVRRVGEPTSEEIREQLERILASRQFARSGRLTRFLRFSIEHSLAGTSDQVKEYLVGVEVFDRKPNYDPRVDPIVRVEARRLRSKLTAYYTSSGSNDRVAIELPRGAYTPVFRLRESVADAAPRETPCTSIAVLPFTNLSRESGDDYFSDGLTEELIHLLTRVRGLRVMAWHSASQLRGREQDLGGIREQLKVGVVLKGSVRRTAARVRVTAQLVNTESGAFLWSEVYDRQIRDVFAIQEEIARAIVDTLRLALGTPPPQVARPTPHLESYTLCLQGRYHAHRRTREGLRKSAECFEQAIQKDANSALAYAGFAENHCLLADYGMMRPHDAIPKARTAALKALELDPNCAEAYHSLAIIRSLYDWQWSDAESIYRRGIALKPGYAEIRHWFAVDFLGMLGRYEEAVGEIHAAQQLDPLSLITHEGVGYLHMLRGEYSEAIQAHSRLLDLDPSFYKAYSAIARVLSLQGRYDEAIGMFEKARSLGGDVPTILAARGQTLALAGRRGDALTCLAELNRRAGYEFIPSTCFAILHLGLGETDDCLACLEDACDQREFSVKTINVHPVYDPVRTHPRFQRLRQRLGFLP